MADLGARTGIKSNVVEAVAQASAAHRQSRRRAQSRIAGMQSMAKLWKRHAARDADPMEATVRRAEAQVGDDVSL
ncbi:MAG: hypothetical protein ACREUG_00960, partial [Steroidobacteraceae bacterium]